MAYIGKQPLVGNFIKLDAITASATDTYNLLNDSVAYTPQSAMNCIVSLNGVIQAPITAYTIVGTTIVFSTTLSASDTIDFILVLGDVLDVGTVSDDTISTAKIKDLAVTAGKLAAAQDLSTKTITLPASVSGLGTGITNAQLAGSIADAKITGLSSSKLSGALPAISGASLTALPATLPASSGVNLTDLNATNLGSGTVPTARLGTGTASSSVFLAGDNTWAAAGGGAWTLIETQTASADATIDFTTLSADYIDFKIICSNVVPATDGQGGWFRLSTSSSFLTSGYTWAMSGSDQDAAVKTNGSSTSSTHINVNYSGIGNTVGENLYCEFTVSDVHDTVNQKMCSFTSSYGDSTPDFEQIRGGGTHPATTAAIDGLQFLFSAGNVTSGEFTLYGRKVT